MNGAGLRTVDGDLGSSPVDQQLLARTVRVNGIAPGIYQPWIAVRVQFLMLLSFIPFAP
jgi:hypothetical protein